MDKWIPVKERLPKEEMMADKYHEVQVLVCMDDEFIATTCYTEEGFELWAESGEVIAWMPLPTPYKGDKYTTADNIRSMTDEQLAEFLKSYPGFNHLSYKEVLNWLKIEDGGGC